MTFKTMQDDQLQETLLKTVQRERQLTAQVLEMLKEVEERRLFAKRGYSSLHAFCTECLGYSEGAAHRRISSMRLMREVPGLKSKLESGTINISNLSKAASFFRQEEKLNKKTYTTEKKEELLLNLEGKSQKEVERHFVKLSPQAFAEKTMERALSEELTEIRLAFRSILNPIRRTPTRKLAKSPSTTSMGPLVFI